MTSSGGGGGSGERGGNEGGRGNSVPGDPSQAPAVAVGAIAAAAAEDPAAVEDPAAPETPPKAPAAAAAAAAAVQGLTIVCPLKDMPPMSNASVELCRREPHHWVGKAARLLAREGEKKGVERSS